MGFSKGLVVAILVVIGMVLVIAFTGYFGTRFTPGTASCADIGGNCQSSDYESNSNGCGFDAFLSPLSKLDGACPSTQICCSKGLGDSEPEPQQASVKSIVFISGVENGECVVPSVNLWSKPGNDGYVVSTVQGCTGFPVQVIETRYASPTTWYHVKTYGVNAGKSGWVAEIFVKE